MILAHHQHWRCIRTIDQQAGFLVDRQVERAQRAPAAALLEPRFGGSEQRSKYVGIVFGGDQAEIAGSFVTQHRREAIDLCADVADVDAVTRSEEHTSELQSLMRISYAVFCLKKKIHNVRNHNSKLITTSENIYM